MDDSYLTLANEASVLCGQIAADIRELEEVEAAIAKEDRGAAGGSGTGTGRTVNATPVSKVIKPALSTIMTPSRAKADNLDESAPAAATLTPLRAEGALASPVLIALGSSMREDTDVSSGYVDFGTVTKDEDITAMDHSSVDRMLKHSMRPSTLAKYSRLWDKWASFSALHEVETVPPDMKSFGDLHRQLRRAGRLCGGRKLDGGGRGPFHGFGGLAIPVHNAEVIQDSSGNSQFLW
jgi:hypothetical protein